MRMINALTLSAPFSRIFRVCAVWGVKMGFAFRARHVSLMTLTLRRSSCFQRAAIHITSVRWCQFRHVGAAAL